MIKLCAIFSIKESEVFNKYFDAFVISDFEDDWENLLSNEFFVM